MFVVLALALVGSEELAGFEVSTATSADVDELPLSAEDVALIDALGTSTSSPAASAPRAALRLERDLFDRIEHDLVGDTVAPVGFWALAFEGRGKAPIELDGLSVDSPLDTAADGSLSTLLDPGIISGLAVEKSTARGLLSLRSHEATEGAHVRGGVIGRSADRSATARLAAELGAKSIGVLGVGSISKENNLRMGPGQNVPSVIRRESASLRARLLDPEEKPVSIGVGFDFAKARAIVRTDLPIEFDQDAQPKPLPTEDLTRVRAFATVVLDGALEGHLGLGWTGDHRDRVGGQNGADQLELNGQLELPIDSARFGITGRAHVATTSYQGRRGESSSMAFGGLASLSLGALKLSLDTGAEVCDVLVFDRATATLDPSPFVRFSLLAALDPLELELGFYDEAAPLTLRELDELARSVSVERVRTGRARARVHSSTLDLELTGFLSTASDAIIARTEIVEWLESVTVRGVSASVALRAGPVEARGAAVLSKMSGPDFDDGSWVRPIASIRYWDNDQTDFMELFVDGSVALAGSDSTIDSPLRGLWSFTRVGARGRFELGLGFGVELELRNLLDGSVIVRHGRVPQPGVDVLLGLSFSER
ncbi:MAG: hypothetical protein HY791_00940 [Deltaproteobacteria bacterium]|nr:hypothetical protein [Deltaproteobacteria bacterium]